MHIVTKISLYDPARKLIRYEIERHTNLAKNEFRFFTTRLNRSTLVLKFYQNASERPNPLQLNQVLTIRA